MTDETQVDDHATTAAVAESPASASTGTHFQHLPLSQLSESRTNPRKSFPQDAMRDLTASVKEHGVLVPLLVRPIPSTGVLLWEIVAGARRYRAAKAAGLNVVPTLSRSMTDRQAVEAQVIENLQRADLHPIEEARGYRTLMSEHGYTVEQLATAVHKSEAYIYGRLKLCDLPKGAVQLFEQGLLDASRALLVARIPVLELAEKAAREIAYGDWIVRRYGKKEPPEHDRDPMSFREAKEHIQREYMLRLKDAPFLTSDASLVPSAGSCTSCPKRTGHSQTLFGDVDSKDELCTDPSCFEAKTKWHVERRAAQVRERGGEVLEGKKINAANLAKTVDLDAICYDDPKHRTYRAVLGKAAADMKPTLVRPDDLRVHRVQERVPAADVRQALKAKGITKAAKASAAGPVDKKAASEARAHKRRQAAVKAALPKMRELAFNVSSPAILRFVVCELGSRWEHRGVLKEHGIAATHNGLTEGGVAEVQKLGDGELQGIVVELLAGADRASSKFGRSGYSPSWRRACDLVGLDMKAFEQAVDAEKAAKKKPAKAAKKGRARK